MTIAKTPTVAIARVLRGLGLKQGSDFRVKGKYEGTGANRERIGTYVAIYSAAGEQTVADNADRIEEMVQQDGCFAFRVSIHRTPSGGVWTWIANFGKRTREGHFMDTDADRKRMGLGAGTIGSDAPAEATRKAVKDIEQRPGRTGAPVIRATLGAPRPAFEQPKAPAAPDLDAHPYDGLAQKPFGSLTWACEEAGRTWFFQNTRNSPRYTLRATRGWLVGWYLSGPGIGQPGSDRYMGATVTIAATAAQDVILEHAWITGRMEEAATQWPKGTRVQGVDSYGVTCMGTVNGVSWGVVTDQDHENYGRTWVDVTWDEYPHNRGTGRRNRPFTSDLIRH